MPQKRTTSKGTVYWVGRVRPPGRSERSQSFPTRREAKEWEDEQKSQLRKGTWVDQVDGDVTVGSLVLEWAAKAQAHGTKENRLNLHANLGALTDAPIRAVRPQDIDEWVTQLTTGRPWADGRPLGASHAEIKRSQLSGIFTNAVADMLISKSPFRQAVVSISTEEDFDAIDRVLSRQQVDLLADTAINGGQWVEQAKVGRRKVEILRTTRKSPALGAAIQLGAGSGLRGGEIAGLQRKHLDLEEGALLVRQQAKTSPTGYRKLKTAKSRREIPLAPHTVEQMRSFLELCPCDSPDEPLFKTVRGQMWTAATLAAGVRKLRPIVDIDWVTFHDLRHFFATALIGSGVSVKAVQELLGHSTPVTTMQVYAHFWPAENEIARSAIQTALTGVRGYRGDEERPNLRAI